MQTFRKLDPINQGKISEMEITQDLGGRRATYLAKNEFVKAVLTGNMSWFVSKHPTNAILAKQFTGLLPEEEIRKMDNKTHDWAYSILVTKTGLLVGPSQAMTFREKQINREKYGDREISQVSNLLTERKNAIFSNLSAVQSFPVNHEDFKVIQQIAMEILKIMSSELGELTDKDIRVLNNCKFSSMHQISLIALMYWDRLVAFVSTSAKDAEYMKKKTFAMSVLGKVLNFVVNNFNPIDMHERSISNQKPIIEKALAGLDGVYDFDTNTGTVISKIGLRGMYFNCRNQDFVTVKNIYRVAEEVTKVSKIMVSDEEYNMIRFK